MDVARKAVVPAVPAVHVLLDAHAQQVAEGARAAHARQDVPLDAAGALDSLAAVKEAPGPTTSVLTS